jgi:Ca2+-binding RTX toxin-like protein
LFEFKATGTFPANGIIITTGPGFLPNPQLDLTEFDFGDPTQVNGLEFFDFEEVSPGRFTISWKMTQPNAFIKTKVFDDLLAEPDASFKVELLPGAGYSVDPNANAPVIFVTDGVAGTGGPKVNLSVDKTTVTEGDSITITFKVDGVVPAEGLQVFVDSDTAGALGEFFVFDDNNNPAFSFTGLKTLPQGNEDASGFSVVMAENTATLTLKLFEDGVDEGVENLVFKLADGEQYDIAAGQQPFTIVISDPLPQNLFGDGGDNILSSGSGNDNLFGNGGNDIFNAGAGNDKIFGCYGNDVIDAGTGDDIIFGNGGNDVINAGAGDDIIYGGAGSLVLDSGAGSDTIWLSGGSDVVVVRKGDGTDTINGFQLGQTKLGLAEGLKFSDLSFIQGAGFTEIRAGSELLAKVNFVSASSLNATSNFTTV